MSPLLNGIVLPVDAVCVHPIAYSVIPPDDDVAHAVAEALKIIKLDGTPSSTILISTSWSPLPKSANQLEILLEESSTEYSLT